MNVMPITMQSNTQNNQKAKLGANNNRPAFGSIVNVEKEGIEYLAKGEMETLSEVLPKLKALYNDRVKFTVKFKDSFLYSMFHKDARVTVEGEKVAKSGEVLNKGVFKLAQDSSDPAKELTSDNFILNALNVFATNSEKKAMRVQVRKQAAIARHNECIDWQCEKLDAEDALKAVIKDITK